MGCCSLHHQLEGGAWSHIPEVLLPQDGARTALDTKKLRKNTWEREFRETHLAFRHCMLPCQTPKKAES